MATRTTDDYWKRVPPEARARLLKHLKLAGSAKPEDIDRALAVPGAVHALSESLVKVADQDLFRWVLQEGPSGAAIHDYDHEATRDAVDRVNRTVVALATFGLAVERQGRVHLLPALSEALRPYAVRWGLSRGAPRGDVPSLSFFLALVLGAYALDPPRVTRSGDVHAAWLTKFSKRFGSDGLLGRTRSWGESILRCFGVLTIREEDDRALLVVNPRTLDRCFSLPARDLMLAVLQVTRGGSDYQRMLGRLEVASRGREEAGVLVEDLIPPPRPAPRYLYSSFEDDEGLWHVTRVLAYLRSLSLVAVDDQTAPIRVRPSTPETHGAARWVVQTSFDVLVGWDVEPLRVARLGLVADLEKVDRVCRYRLSAASIQRGSAALGSAAAVLELLEGGAATPIPQNVRTTVAGWITGTSPLRYARAEVVLPADADQKALVLRVARGAVEIAPGVFALSHGDLNLVLNAARKGAVPVASALGSSTESAGREGKLPGHDPVAMAAAAKEKMAEAAAEAREKPAKTRSPAKPPVRLLKSDDADEDDADEDDEDVDYDHDDDDEDEVEDDGADTVEYDVEKASGEVGATSRAGSGEAVWESPLPGELRSRLEEAVDLDLTIDILYVNAKNETAEHRVEPIDLVAGRGGLYLVAMDETTGVENRFALERITAIRG